MKKVYCTVLLTLFCVSSLLSYGIVINEVMSSNATTISDEDGDYPDWIEICNASDSTINLSGFGISDDEDNLFKWIFPNYMLGENQFLVLFASGKDRKSCINHWETVIDWGDIWRYKLGDSEPSDNWREIEFDDSDWPSGPTGIGYGDNDDATIVPSNTISIYLRKSFIVQYPENITQAILHVDYDDAFVAYLNGIEIARANITGIHPPFNQSADSYTEPKICYGNPPEKLPVENVQNLLVNGDNILAIQVHNHGTSSSDMTIIPFLSLGMANAPQEPQGVPDILNLSETHFHTNFKIQSSGEVLVLTNSSGQIIDQLNSIEIPVDVSRGRKPDAGDDWFYFSESTPGSSNVTQVYLGKAELPQFSIPGGFYDGSQTVDIWTNESDAVIHYTLDGSSPTESSSIFESAINVDLTTVIRTRTYKSNFLPSKEVRATIFIDEFSTLPVVSVATAPENLWDDEIGIYVEGTNGITGYCSNTPKNWNQDWEKAVSLEFFEEGGEPGFSLNAGMKIGGGCTRLYPQKTLAIYARSQYGTSKINYRIFKDKNINSFNNLVLRNAGQDWYRVMFRDGMMQTLVKDCMDLEWQAFRPAILFLNGEYWGIHNIREKHNEHYFESNYGIDPDSIDLLVGNASVKIGDANHYNNLINFISSNDITLNVNYDYVTTQMDIDEYINYQIAEIYFANIDWPGGNIKYWRPKTPTGKWRWVLFDTDLGFGAHQLGQYYSNTLENATATSATYYANPPWSTFLFRKLLENEDFKTAFIQRFAVHLATTFEPERVIQIIDSLQALIAPEIPRHISRWESSLSFGKSWEGNVDIMREFAKNRPMYICMHLREKFDLRDTAKLTVHNSSPNMGTIIINKVSIADSICVIKYFKDFPMHLTALPKEGYRFVGWQGISNLDTNSISVSLTSNSEIAAIFKEGTIGVASCLPVLSAQFTLEQNYPNPFNSCTNIKYAISGQSKVKITVYNISGQVVTVLVNQLKEPGCYSVQWDTSKISSGVYFYRIQAYDPSSVSPKGQAVQIFTDVKKCVIIK